ncbi:MAG: hypothetical protein WDO16_16345 [Bacteroidota bacterium]
MLEPVTDLALLKPHAELVEMLVSTIFPPTNSQNDNLYAVSMPFSYHTIYSSKLFQLLFLKPGSNEVNIPDNGLGRNLSEEKMFFAYAMILKKYYGYTAPEWLRSVYPFPDPASGLIKYLELHIDTRL